MSFDSILSPNAIEKKATHLQEGFMMGWVAGVITDIDDPDGLGRVRVECPLIESGVNLPNDTDGWIPVLEEFVNNAQPGGCHRFLQEGTQVALLPMHGDPRQMLVIGCLPSRVDRPHPSLNRAQGLHGNVTPGDVIEVNSDRDAAQVIARPNGVIQQISGDGNLTYQTEHSARLQLAQDGTSRLENDEGFTAVSPDGTVLQQSAGAATSVLRADGQVQVTSGSGAQVNLTDGQGVLTGPLSQVSAAIRQVRSQLDGVLGQAHTLLQQAGAIAGEAIADSEAFLQQASTLLGQIDATLTANLAQGTAALNTLATLDTAALGQSLMGQAQTVLGLQQITAQARDWITTLPNGSAIAQALATALPGQTIPATLPATLDGLRHHPDMQVQAILGAAAPNGFHSVQAIVGLGLHEHLATVRGNLALPEVPLSDATPELEVQRLAQATAQAQRIAQVLPPNSGQSLEQLTALVAANTPEASLQALLGRIAAHRANQTQQSVATAAAAAAPLATVAAATEAAKAGDVTPEQTEVLRSLVPTLPQVPTPEQIVEQAIPQAIAQLQAQLSPLINQAVADLNQVINSIPSAQVGSAVRAFRDFAQMETALGEAGAIVRALPGVAEMLGPGGITRMFSDAGGAGVSTPWGGFGFSPSGSSFSSLGRIAMQVASGVGGAGLTLSPNPGAALNAFFPAEVEAAPVAAATLSVEGQVATIRSYAPTGEVLHELRVTDDAIYLDDITLAELRDWISLIESTLAALATAQSSSLQAQAALRLDTARLTQQHPAGTHGGTFSAGAWRDRPFNTVAQSAPWVSLNAATAVITLTAPPTGLTVRLRVEAITYNVGVHRLRLFDPAGELDPEDEGYLTEVAATVLPADLSTTVPMAILTGTLTLVANQSRAFKVQHRCTSSQGTYGMGLAANFTGIPEIFATLHLERLA